MYCVDDDVNHKNRVGHVHVVHVVDVEIISNDIHGWELLHSLDRTVISLSTHHHAGCYGLLPHSCDAET